VFSDEVTGEAFVNANVRALPLSAAPEDWAGLLLSLSRQTPDPAMATFDIDLQADRLAGWYLEKMK